MWKDREYKMWERCGGRENVLPQATHNTVNKSWRGHRNDRKKEGNIGSLKMQQTISEEYHRSKKVKLSHKLIWYYWFAFNTKPMKRPKPYLA